MGDKRILVVDDDDDIRDVVRLSLQLAGGMSVLAAGSGCEGLGLAAATGPDAILLDVTMPGMDGLEVLRRLKSDAGTASIPVVLLTAKVRAAEAGRTAGAAGVIVKPFDPLRLAEQIAEILGWDRPRGAPGR